MAESIVINGISKRYGKVQALQGVSLSVGEGELFGLIGPDGAGKTTLFRLLTTLLLPDEGSATVCGLDLVKDYRLIRQQVGYMPGRFSLYPDLSVEDNLVAPIYSQIEPFRKRKAGKLSGGMKQKLALSCALIHKPRVLFLDEPTTGVDVVSRVEFWDMLQNLRRQGITILVSTPYMDEAQRCTRVALISGGTILGVDTPEEVVRKSGQPTFGDAFIHLMSRQS